MFKFLNTWFMVPLFRLGLGGWMTNPFTGYIMVLKVIGRKTGKVRYAPVNYAIWNGDVFCVSGGRKTSDWYKNLIATPNIEIILPGGAIFGHVTEEVDPAVRLTTIRKIFCNAGFAGFFEGYDPRKISDEELIEKIADIPLLRIKPAGAGNGASDPSGWAWIMVFLLFALAIMLAIVL